MRRIVWLLSSKAQSQLSLGETSWGSSNDEVRNRDSLLFCFAAEEKTSEVGVGEKLAPAIITGSRDLGHSS